MRTPKSRHAAGRLLCVWTAGAATLLAAAAFSQPAQPGQASAATTWDGVYSDAQAARGQSAYGRSCGGCHQDDLGGGDEGEPPLRGPDFARSWEGYTVAALYDTVATEMPKSNPGSLPLETCIDIVAFLLQSNGMPSGLTELTTDIEALDRIHLTATAPAP